MTKNANGLRQFELQSEPGTLLTFDNPITDHRLQYALAIALRSRSFHFSLLRSPEAPCPGSPTFSTRVKHHSSHLPRSASPRYSQMCRKSMRMEKMPFCDRVGDKSIHSRWMRRKRRLVRRTGMYDQESWKYPCGEDFG